MNAPLVPDAGAARRLLREELADPVYEAARPGPLGRALGWLWGQLSSLELPGGPGGVGAAVLLGVLAVVVVLAVRAVGVPGPGGTRAAPAGLVDAGTSAEQYRARAARARAAGDHAVAVREGFRAVVRGAEERALLDPDPGRTADEAAAALGAWLPGLAADLAALAGRFDDVTYGSRPASRADAEQAMRVDAAVAATRPAGGPVAQHGAVGASALPPGTAR